MIVIGGIGSVGGAVAGAVFVTLLPLVLNRYSDLLPLLAQPGSSGISAADLSRIIYGLAIILILLFAHDGLAGLARRLRTTRRGVDRAPDPTSPSPTTKELSR
jgi:branched-chain amino acid transport system permease protein